MPGIRRISESFFGATMPTTGPIAAGPISLSYWFTLDVDCRLVGFRQAAKMGDLVTSVFQVWDQSGALVCQQAPSAKRTNLPLPADGWFQVWNRPIVDLVALANYQLVLSAWNDVFSSIGVIAGGPLISGHITIPTNDPVRPGNLNGLYVQPPDINSPPSTPTGNLYGVDILIDTL